MTDAPGSATPTDIYRPRKDSYLLKEAMEEQELVGNRVLDMGTGSGILAVAAARHGATVTAVDVNPRAVDAVRKQARRNGLDIEAVRSDLFDGVSGRYDLVVFNPPYIPAEPGEQAGDTAWAGGVEGREVLDRFLRTVGDYLKADGTVLLLQSSRNDVEQTVETLRVQGLDATVVQEEQLHFETLVVVRAEGQ